MHDYNVCGLDFGFSHQAHFWNTTGSALLHKLIRDGPPFLSFLDTSMFVCQIHVWDVYTTGKIIQNAFSFSLLWDW